MDLFFLEDETPNKVANITKASLIASHASPLRWQISLNVCF